MMCPGGVNTRDAFSVLDYMTLARVLDVFLLLLFACVSSLSYSFALK